MTTAEQVLVIYLSTALAVFLIIAIIAGVYAIKVLKALDRITVKAENLVDSAEAVGEMVKQTAQALSITRMLQGLANFVKKKQDNDDKDDDKKGKGDDV